MSISAVFKSNLPFFQYLFKDGVAAIFLEGKYTTDNPARIRELAAEVGEVGKYKSKHPYIFVDEDEQEIDSEALTPLELIKLQAKEEARQELLAEQAALNQKAADNVSFSQQTNFANSLNNTEKQTVDATSAEKKTEEIMKAPVSAPAIEQSSTQGLGAKLANLSVKNS